MAGGRLDAGERQQPEPPRDPSFDKGEWQRGDAGAGTDAGVPDEAQLVVEAGVENKDVGFVHPGQRAEIKVEAFSFTRYGMVDGTVQALSRDAVLEGDDRKKPDRAKADARRRNRLPIWRGSRLIEARSIRKQGG